MPLPSHQPLPELMDDPALDPASHRQALAGLHRINRASGTARHLAAPILRLARRHRLSRLSRLSLLDIACGGADVPIAVALLARRHGITLDLTLTDKSPTALAAAQEHAAKAGIPARCIPSEIPPSGNVSTLDPLAPFDIVTNSLFLHHLPAPAVIATLSHMKAWTRRLLLISDLRRSALGYAIAWTGCRLLSRSPIVHHDGPASVRSAYTLPELADLAAQAGLTGAQLHPSFPWRMLLQWEPPT